MRQLKRDGAEPFVDSPEPEAPAQFDNPFRRNPDFAEVDDHVRSEKFTRENAAEIIGFDRNEKSTFLGVAHFVGALSFYAATLAGVYLIDWLPARIALSLINGLAIGVLFIAGHDGCHGGLTPNAALNKQIASFAFLPSLHTYSAWFYSHNVLHHGWTNLKGRDPVYAPKTVAEFRALSPFGRLRERIYRSIPGVALLYLVTIWIEYEILPSKRRRDAISRYGNFEVERAAVLAFLAAHVATVIVLSSSFDAAAASLLLGVILPFLVWNWLIGIVTYFHHMHPSIPWFDSVKDWSFEGGQLRGSAHVEFPPALDFIMLRIMQHTAHHVCAEIPMYRLKKYQARLDGEAVVYKLSLKSLREIFAQCQLYDYREKRWLRFSAAD